MKNLVLIGLLALALAAPVAAAHVAIAHPDPRTGECTITEIGRPTTGPHVSAWVGGCGPIWHYGPALP